jgi:hypothetical protein
VAPTLTRGVFMGSPVFDGAKESEIKALLERRVCQIRARRLSTTA